MSSAAVPQSDADVIVGTPAKGHAKLLILAIPVLLALIGAGLWFGGILPPLLGLGAKPPSPVPSGDRAAMPKPPAFVDMPEVICNMNAGARRNVFVKLHARLEIARAEDAPLIAAAMPRLLDLFQTYLREMRPEELRGSAGTWRLREELIARANIAAAPARTVDVLFTELLVQ